MKSQPFSNIVEFSERPHVCEYCYKYKCPSLKKCSQCKLVSYCQISCQKKAWLEYHQNECTHLKKLQESFSREKLISLPTGSPLFYALFIARILHKLKNGGDKEFFEFPNGQRRYFKDLVSHQEDIARDDTNVSDVKSVHAQLHTLLGPTNSPSFLTVLQIYGKIIINCQDILNDEMIPIGLGLYLGPSAIDHSCAPNAVWIFNGREMIVRTIENVPNFSALRVTYLPKLYENTRKRQEILLRDYFFSCNCEVCQDEDSNQLKFSLICSQCKGCVPLIFGKCNDCDCKLNPISIEKYKNLKAKLLNAISNASTSEDQETCEKLFEAAVKVFHPFDEIFMNFLFLLWNKYYYELNVIDHRNCLTVLELMTQNYYKNLPKYFHGIGIRELMLASLSNALNLQDKALIHITNAEDILKVGFGENHPRVTEDCKSIRQLILSNQNG